MNHVSRLGALALVLESIDVPHWQRKITDEEAGASVRVISSLKVPSEGEDVLTTLENSPATTGWTEFGTDWPKYADLILQGLLARGLEIREIER
jgi:hypothetical protein